MMNFLFQLAVFGALAGLAWWYRSAWVEPVKRTVTDTLSPIVMPRRVLSAHKLMLKIVKSATRQLPKGADGNLALPRQLLIHLSPEDFAKVSADYDAMHEEVVFRVIRFAEVNGELTKPWWPEVSFSQSVDTMEGWPRVTVSHNMLDAARSSRSQGARSFNGEDELLRRKVRQHYATTGDQVDEAGTTPTRHFPPDDATDQSEDDGQTHYTGQLTEYMDHDDFGPLYAHLPTSLVPLDADNPTVHLEHATLLGRGMLGGSKEVSRAHCTLEPVRNGWSLTDKGSTNGTLINGKPVRGTKALFDGDKIQFGASGPVYLFNRQRPAPGCTPDDLMKSSGDA